MAAVGPASCVLDKDLKLPMEYDPEPLSDGWPVGDPADVGVDPAAIREVYERFFSEDDYILGRSLLVARRGTLIAEGYVRHRSDRERLQHVKSVTKSLTSLLTGQALERGVLPGLDARLGDLLSEAADRGGEYAELTIEDLLTMRSGLDWENSVQTGELMVEEPANSVEFILARSMVRTPGVDPHYADSDPHLVGAAISRSAGQSLESLARQWLYEPLGIRESKWENGRDEIDYGAYGAWLRPRDMLKIGEMCRLGGQWGETQVVPTSWIEDSSATAVDIDGEPYAYYWWVKDVLSPGAYSADGHGGQYIFVLPAHELVCVQTAHPYTPTHEDGIVSARTEELIEVILDGLLD
jgi:CubicO group peptidase (beta-lactamase class C family)